eukprot:scaffold83086_cov22-Tisochrysis_lutea.AAC.2
MPAVWLPDGWTGWTGAAGMPQLSGRSKLAFEQAGSVSKVTTISMRKECYPNILQTCKLSLLRSGCMGEGNEWLFFVTVNWNKLGW